MFFPGRVPVLWQSGCGVLRTWGTSETPSQDCRRIAVVWLSKLLCNNKKCVCVSTALQILHEIILTVFSYLRRGVPAEPLSPSFCPREYRGVWKRLDVGMGITRKGIKSQIKCSDAVSWLYSVTQNCWLHICHTFWITLLFYYLYRLLIKCFKF